MAGACFASALGLLILAGCGNGPEDVPPADAPIQEAPVTPADPAEPDTPRPVTPDPEPARPDTPVAADPPVADPAPPPPAEDPAVQVRVEEGVVTVTGTGVAPTAVLTTDEGASLGLTGDLARELRRLTGIRVRVEGRSAATPVGPGIEVASYRILEVEGREPVVGILYEEDDGVWTLTPEEGPRLQLEGMPTAGVADGMKVWILGEPAAGNRLRVESYGIISPMGS
jgi:hypothetical protein